MLRADPKCPHEMTAMSAYNFMDVRSPKSLPYDIESCSIKRILPRI
jgi:hypothetical protein